MSDIILDCSVLGDFLAQYFSSDYANRGSGLFKPEASISRDAARRLNRIVSSFRNEDAPSVDRVILCPLGFIELARKWQEITLDRFTVDQFQAFIKQPPEWVSIASWDETILPSFMKVPNDVQLPSGAVRPIEWTDAVYVATALARGVSSLLATTDARLLAIKFGDRLFVV